MVGGLPRAPSGSEKSRFLRICEFVCFLSNFLPRLGSDISRNAFGVFVYAFEKKLYGGIGFFMTPRSRDFHEILSFLESRREATGDPLGWIAIVRNYFRVSFDEFQRLKMFEKIWLTSMSFQVLDDFRSVLMFRDCVAGP